MIIGCGDSSVEAKEELVRDGIKWEEEEKEEEKECRLKLRLLDVNDVMLTGD